VHNQIVSVVVMLLHTQYRGQRRTRARRSRRASGDIRSKNDFCVSFFLWALLSTCGSILGFLAISFHELLRRVLATPISFRVFGSSYPWL
jgi:hypothetical protein